MRIRLMQPVVIPFEHLFGAGIVRKKFENFHEFDDNIEIHVSNATQK